MSRNHRRGRIALSRKIERDMELAARKEREEVRRKALEREKLIETTTYFNGTVIEREVEVPYGK